MNIEDIINKLDGLRFILERKRDRERADTGVFRASSSRVVAINAAIDLLRTHPDAQPNEPLTLEALKEVNGQPVWCQPDEGVGCWVLVTVRASKVVVRDQYGMTADVEVWMKRGERYYRRPPKEA